MPMTNAAEYLERTAARVPLFSVSPISNPANTEISRAAISTNRKNRPTFLVGEALPVTMIRNIPMHFALN